MLAVLVVYVVVYLVMMVNGTVPNWHLASRMSFGSSLIWQYLLMFTWVSLIFMQVWTLYGWMSHMKNYGILLLEAHFVYKNLAEPIKGEEKE